MKDHINLLENYSFVLELNVLGTTVPSSVEIAVKVRAPHEGP